MGHVADLCWDMLMWLWEFEGAFVCCVLYVGVRERKSPCRLNNTSIDCSRIGKNHMTARPHHCCGYYVFTVMVQYLHDCGVRYSRQLLIQRSLMVMTGS